MHKSAKLILKGCALLNVCLLLSSNSAKPKNPGNSCRQNYSWNLTSRWKLSEQPTSNHKILCETGPCLLHSSHRCLSAELWKNPRVWKIQETTQVLSDHIARIPCRFSFSQRYQPQESKRKCYTDNCATDELRACRRPRADAASSSKSLKAQLLTRARYGHPSALPWSIRHKLFRRARSEQCWATPRDNHLPLPSRYPGTVIVFWSASHCQSISSKLKQTDRVFNQLRENLSESRRKENDFDTKQEHLLPVLVSVNAKTLPNLHHQAQAQPNMQVT